jgi:hypothetical protein
MKILPNSIKAEHLYQRVGAVVRVLKNLSRQLVQFFYPNVTLIGSKLKPLRASKITKELLGQRLQGSPLLYGVLLAGYILVAIGFNGGKAAGPVASIEPENGTVTAPATVITDVNASGSSAVMFGNIACTNNASCWPNVTNTGYQNAPGYPGTHGVADPTKLTTASSSSSTCPTTFQSNHTYSFCRYSGGGNFIGNGGNLLTNVHFVGVLFEDTNQTSDPGKDVVMVYCSSNCTFDYITIKPQTINAPDLPGHGTSYANGYGVAMGVGWGDYGTVGHGVSITHSDIWGFGSGIILGSNTAATPILIQDNWLHDQSDCPNGCDYHTDGIGMVNTGGSSSYVTIDHNNMPFIQDNTNDIAFQEGTYDHLTITNNIFSGDGYTIAIWDTSSNITFTGNVWTNYGQQLFKANYGRNFWSTSGSTWANNKFLWDPGGANPFYALGPGSGNVGPITASDSGKYWLPCELSGTNLSTSDYVAGSCN